MEDIVTVVERFFFQAEDGIRDIGVTGVQTCALPISSNVKRRVIAAFVAVLLAAGGGLLLLGYVNDADRRAMAGMETVDVLVVAKPIPEGTAGDRLSELVRRKTVPMKIGKAHVRTPVTP